MENKGNSTESLNEKTELVWESKNGLRYISDKSLEIAYKFIENGSISVSIKPDKKTVINNNIINLCDKKYDTDQLYDALKNKEGVLNGNKIFRTKNSDFIRALNYDIDKTCFDCKFEKCPKYIAAYILYLKNNGLLEEKLKDRDEFRKNHKLNDKFDFDWIVEDGLKNVPENLYRFCEELVNRKVIWVDNTLSNDKFVTINSAFSCNDYRLLNYDIDKLYNIDKKFSKWTHIRRPTTFKIGICNTYSCRLSLCPYEIAGYIYYLEKSGRKDEIEKDRRYYYEHKAEIDAKSEELKLKKIEEMRTNQNNYLEEFREYIDKMDNVDNLVDTILNKLQTNLHCSVEGEDRVGKDRFILKIVTLLNRVGKIKDTNIKRISLQNLATDNAYSITSKANIKNRDINGVLYETEKAIKYTELEENKVYILTGIKEFVKDYKTYRNAGNHEFAEIRHKQFKHALELLSRMSFNNYIILDGIENEVDELLELEPKLQFIYQSYRFKFNGLSFDEMYDLYVSKIKSELIDDIRKNSDEYKRQFIEYVSLNKNFIPFSDRELSNYLAMYSNSRNEIVFPNNIYKKETVEESLKNIIGLDNVKSKVKDFEKYMLFKVKAKANGLNLKSTNMHMIFTGNPGTGKTTIARIMAKMLFDLGVIKENKLIEVERKDLVANYIGQTATKTTEVIDKAMGGVLFIDEAYSLAGKGENDFGLEAIATLIKAMEDHKEKLVVIFAGYKDEMKTFIDSNAGIASRIGYTFDFPDYSPDELVEMFNIKMKNMGFVCKEDTKVELSSICKYYSQKKSFGNGRFIDKLMQETIMKHAINDNNDIKVITRLDIPSIEELNNTKESYTKTEIDEILNNIVGMNSLKEKIKEFEKYVKFIKEAENNKISIPNQNLHMIFTGNPGTGKTTIARIMAKMLSDLGIIHENKLIEVEKKDLIAGYTGQTAPKTAEVIERAIGGVLFIDEAYSITEGNDTFGLEAISTLIKAMEDHKGEFVVIFAGYKKEMSQFIESNSGIASRIGYTFDFPDYTDTELTEIFYRKIEKCGIKVDKEACILIEKIMKYFCNVDNIGNGRFVDRVLQETLMKHAKNENKIDIISKDDIPTIQEMSSCLFNGNNMIDPSRITGDSLRKTAIHEVGHASVRLLLNNEPGIKRITINAEGTGSLGYVLHSVSSDYVRSKSKLLNEIKVLLAGMGAEQVYLGEFANGNGSDLEKATRIARSMVMYHGMSDMGLGQVLKLEGEVARVVQEEINKILDICFKETLSLINENKDKMDNVIEYLLEHKEINENEFLEQFNKVK